MSDQCYIRLLYRMRLGKKINLNNPKAFTEKINWLKLYYRPDILTKLADKYEVRGYVRERVGAGYLIPLIAVFNEVEEINFSNLPEQYILKATHGSGWNIICRDKGSFDVKSAIRFLKLFLTTNYYQINRSWEYKNIKPRIVCEQFLVTGEGEGLDDYKIHCFQGQPKYIQHLTGRLAGQTEGTFYDLTWEPQEFYFTNPKHNCAAPAPSNLVEMLDIAVTLSEDLPYARIDLYNQDGKIYFGEITLHPVNGMDKFFPDIYDGIWGDYLNLDVLCRKFTI